jgi:hypothetical protein
LEEVLVEKCLFPSMHMIGLNASSCRVKDAKVGQKNSLLKIPFKNMTFFFKNTRKWIQNSFIFHFENIYAYIVFIVS